MREYLLVMLASAAATYLLCGLARRIALKTGVMASVRARDVHTHPTPYLGGAAMLGGIAVGVLVASRTPFLSAREVVTQDSLGILVSCTVIALVGLIDDLIELPAVAKTAGQMLAAGVAALFGVRLYWISLPGRIIALDPVTSMPGTLIFIFVCVTAINFVDGGDGVAAGLVGFGAAGLFSYTYVLARLQHWVLATTSSLISVTIVGACLGFLPHNFHRAKIFMGDTGSMVLGLALCSSSLSLTGQIDSSALSAASGVLPNWLPLLLPFAIMAIPMADMVMAYIRRTNRGHWWYEADKQHLHHRLVRMSRSQVKAVLILYSWTALIAFGIVVAGLTQSLIILVIVLVLWALAAVATALLLRHLRRTMPLPAGLI